MINIIPAIDLIQGQCVRLVQGDFDRITTYNKPADEMVIQYREAGFSRIHIVDLDGARQGRPVQKELIKSLCLIKGLEIQSGGGILEPNQVSELLDAGLSAVVIGSLAIRNPDAFRLLLRKYGGEKIILGADVRRESLQINGWKKNSGINIFSFLHEFLDEGLQSVIVTDIEKDGMLKGPGFNLYKTILDRFPQIRLTASGGVSSVADLFSLNELGISSVIVGKAFYEGKIQADSILEILRNHAC